MKISKSSKIADGGTSGDLHKRARTHSEDSSHDLISPQARLIQLLRIASLLVKVRKTASLIRGAPPETPGFTAFGPESFNCLGTACAAPAIPAPESTLGSHPCVALPFAQVLSEWKILTPSCHDFSLNGKYPLNLLSHARGSLQRDPYLAEPLRTVGYRQRTP
jgi:hypothetical protein